MKKTNKPLVSILMPVYNAERFVVEAIESVLTQTYENIELIVVDDGSSDASPRLIRRYARQYPQKIKAIFLRKNANRGGDAAGNVAFSHSRGAYIARMDADDIALPDRIAKQVDFLEKHPAYAVVGTRAWVINKRGEVVGEKRVPLTHERIYREFFVFHPMIHPTVMVRKSVLGGRKNLYHLEYMANNDYLTFMELISQGFRFANLSEKLVCYRVHGNNDSLVQVKSRFLNSLKIRYRAVRDFGYRPSLLGVLKLFCQVIMVAFLPEKMIVPLYMVARGIVSWKDVWKERRVNDMRAPAKLN